MNLKTTALLLLAGATPVLATQTVKLEADNDFAVFAGTNNSITRLLFNNNYSLFSQLAGQQTLNLELWSHFNETDIYVLAMDGGAGGAITGIINGKSIGGAGTLYGAAREGISGVQMSQDIAQYLTGFSTAVGYPNNDPLNTVSSAQYNARLQDVQLALASGITWSNPSYGTWGSGEPAVYVPTNKAYLIRFSGTSAGIIPAVPEPSTYGLIGIGALGLAFAARRRKLKTK